MVRLDDVRGKRSLSDDLSGPVAKRSLMSRSLGDRLNRAIAIEPQSEINSTTTDVSSESVVRNGIDTTQSAASQNQ